MTKRLLLAVLLVWGGCSWWSSRAITHRPGVLVAQMPEQEQLAQARPFDYKGYRITPLARFAVRARLLSREDYRFGREADLSPTDFGVGWGRMSDDSVLDKLEISQSGRFLYWRAKELPIPQREIETSSANMHLIPADRLIERQMARVRRGAIVELHGQLVRVDAADGWHWVSSLTREDTGAGACELFWVERLTIL